MDSMTEIACVADLNLTSDELLVAFASMDGECVDQHFGSSQGFYVYQIDSNGAELVASKHFAKELKDGNEDKLKPKLAWLLGCDMVYCGSVGGSATKQLIARGVHPFVVKEGPDVEELIEDLRCELMGEPSTVLQRILQAKKPKEDDRFDSMDDEGWDG